MLRSDSRAAASGQRGHEDISRRIFDKAARALRRAQCPAHCRRNSDGLRTHGKDVRLRPCGCQPRHHVHIEGADRRVHADGDNNRDRQNLRRVLRRLQRGQGLHAQPHLQRQPARLRRGARRTENTARGQNNRKSRAAREIPERAAERDLRRASERGGDKAHRPHQRNRTGGG